MRLRANFFSQDMTIIIPARILDVFQSLFNFFSTGSRQCFQINPSSFEMTTTTDEHFYAAIRVSSVINNHTPSAIQINSIPPDDQQYLFRQGNQLSTRSSTIIYSVAMPLRNTSILDHEVLKASTTCLSPESIVTTLNDTREQESE